MLGKIFISDDLYSFDKVHTTTEHISYILLKLHCLAPGLDSSLEEHIPQLLAHCICGHDLLKLSQQQLEYLKVGNDCVSTYHCLLLCTGNV